jgi:hypothetical protein
MLFWRVFADSHCSVLLGAVYTPLFKSAMYVIKEKRHWVDFGDFCIKPLLGSNLLGS